ncbi:hypothetical protein BOX15_Mlig009531g3 [Macrostomum lignano]|uniref:Uncharacterized protein n=1 Tax=Macrostomum lignano TaxID=282301 RepID=A0A267FK83_9PLAT|nr:hypothetical protein BOX15_Mlig009531g3 [Macrostomum lignano]
MRWKFWKKAEPAQQQQLPAEPGRSLSRRKKRRHFEASCIAGADTGDEEFVFEGFERRAVFAVRQPAAQQPPPEEQQPPPLPPPRKKESHSLPRFLRRAASVGRSGKVAATGQAGNAASGSGIAEKANTSSDEGLPSASSGDLLSAEDESPLAYCPHCRAVVQPLTMKKRSQIRTNPWLRERKRPRIEDSGVMQKSLDSGISGIEEVGSRAPPSMQPAETTATAAQTEDFEDFGTSDCGLKTVQAQVSLVGTDSDGSSTPVLEQQQQFQSKRKVLKKRRHRQRSHQQSPEQRWDCGSSNDEDLAADAEVMAIHNSAFGPDAQPLSIMAEGVASVGFVPEEQQLMAVAEVTPVSMSSGADSSSLWWDMDRRQMLLMMAPPPDTSSCSSGSSLNLTEAAACQTPVLRSDSEGTEFDSPADTDSDSEMEFELPSPSPKSTEESLAEAVQRLAAQRDSLDRRFRDAGEATYRSGGGVGGGLFARELELYRRELLLRALASVRDQLDYQMLQLEQQPPPPPPPPQPPQNCLRQASDPCGRLPIVRCGPGERMSYH